MPIRNRVLTVVGALVVAGVALLLFDGARPDGRWTVLGAERTLDGEGSGQRFDAGLGLMSGPTASNAFVRTPQAATMTAGHFWSEKTYYDDEGQLAREVVQFPEGRWHEVQADVLERDVPTLLGGTAVRYKVRVTGAVTADGKHWMFRPEVQGHGRAGYSIRADVRFREASRRVEVEVLESFDAGPADRYAFAFALEAGGELRALD